MALATLSIDIVAQLATMQESLDKAYRENEKAAERIEARWNKAQSVLAGIGAAFGGALSVGALVDFTLRTNDAFDALNDLKDATGSSIENLSALEDVARRNGGTLETVSTSLIKFNSALKDADGKNEVSRALKAIGLDSEELKGIDPAEALLKTAQALQQFEDDGNKARLTQVLFGKATKEVAAYLNDLADAGKLVGSVTTEQAKEAEKLNKQLAFLRTNAEDAGRSIVATFVPALNSWSEAIANSAKNGTIMIDVLKGLSTNGLFTVTGKALAGTVNNSTELERLQQVIVGLEAVQQREPNNEANNRRLGYYKKQAQEYIDAQQEMQRFASRAAAANLEPPKPSVGTLAADKTGSKTGSASAKGEDAFVFMTPSLESALKALNNTDTAKLKELRGTLAELLNIQQTGNADPKQTAEAIKTIKDQIEKLTGVYSFDTDKSVMDAFKASEEEIKRRTESMNRSVGSLLGNTQSGQIQRLNDLRDALDGFVMNNGQSEQTAQAYQMIADQMDYLAGKSASLGQMIEANLGSGIRAALKGDWEGLASIFENVLIDSISSDLEKLLKSQLGSLTGGGSGGLLSIAGAFLGIPGFASGGSHSGGLRVVGENGPELEATGPSRIWNAAQTQKMLGGAGGSKAVVIDQTGLQINVGQGVSIGQVQEAMRQTQLSTLAAVKRARMVEGA